MTDTDIADDEGITIPAHLTPALRAIWDEVIQTVYDDTPPAVVESLCTQIKTMRDARALIEKDGIIVTDGKNNAVEHPALAIERATMKAISEMNKVWAVGR